MLQWKDNMAANGASRQFEDIETIRIPILGSPGNRGTDETKDQRFVNGYFWEVKNPVTGKATYFFVKRPGLALRSQPTGGAAVGRGIYRWKGAIYTIAGTKILKNSTDLGVTMRTSTGLVSFAETRPGATNQYLGINDGTDLFLVDTTDKVTILNNVAITSSSVANPSVIVAAAHGLTTGNKVIIRAHTGSTPDINGTAYTITKIDANSFSIPVNVTIGGTGGTIGVFPTANSGALLYVDGYFMVFKTAGVALYNSEVDDPTTWDPTKFIVAQMFDRVGVAIARQNNLVIVFSEASVQAFYDNANATGSPFTNYESAIQQVGASNQGSIVQDEALVTWVGNSFTGGHTVWKLDGITNLKEIATTPVRLLLDSEGASLSNSTGSLIRIGGKRFYILQLSASSRTLIYDYDLDIWSELEATDGTGWPIISTTEFSNVLVGQHPTNGKLYNILPTTYQDDSVNFTVTAQFGRLDLDTNRRKFVKSYDLLGDKQSTTTPVLFQYSDDDYNTLSTARTFDMQYSRPFLTRGGSFRRRAHKLSYTGSNPLRLEGLEMRYRLGDN